MCENIAAQSSRWVVGGTLLRRHDGAISVESIGDNTSI